MMSECSVDYHSTVNIFQGSDRRSDPASPPPHFQVRGNQKTHKGEVRQRAENNREKRKKEEKTKERRMSRETTDTVSSSYFYCHFLLFSSSFLRFAETNRRRLCLCPTPPFPFSFLFSLVRLLFLLFPLFFSGLDISPAFVLSVLSLCACDTRLSRLCRTRRRFSPAGRDRPSIDVTRKY